MNSAPTIPLSSPDEAQARAELLTTMLQANATGNLTLLAESARLLLSLVP